MRSQRSLCPKSRNAYRLTDIFSPPFHARSPTLHSVNSASFSSCGGCSIAATPPRRSSSAKKSSLPEKGHHFFCSLRCLGGFPINNYCHNYSKRKRKKASKVSIHSSLPVGRAFLHSRSSFLLFKWLSFFLFFLFE